MITNSETINLQSDLLSDLVGVTPTQVMGERSNTFSSATERFPSIVGEKIKVFYAFVRVADDFVDAEEDLELNKQKYLEFKARFWHALDSGERTGIPVLDDFIGIFNEYDFERAWVEDFFISMEMDLGDARYESIQEIESYIHGAAGVIGYMCARIFGFPKDDEASYYAAHQLGFAFQYINFIRDIEEDSNLGRNYFPLEDYDPGFIEAVNRAEFPIMNAYNFALYCQSEDNQDLFAEFIRKQVNRYQYWNQEGMQTLNELVSFSPGVAVPVVAATVMYQRVCEQILDDPFIVLEGKLKPAKVDKTIALLSAFTTVFFYGMRMDRVPKLMMPYLRAPEAIES